MRLVVIALALAISCGSSVPLATEDTSGGMFCFAAVVSAPDGRRMAGCADTESLCERGLSLARSWAAVAGVLSLGRCERKELR